MRQGSDQIVQTDMCLIDVTKENPSEEETEESDKERIAELFRTGNFTVSVLSKDGVPSFSTDERELLTPGKSCKPGEKPDKGRKRRRAETLRLCYKYCLT